MRRFIVMFLFPAILFLTACGSSIELARSTSMSIVFLAQESLAPARWVFQAQGDEDITSYQWQFSDDNFTSISTGSVDSIEHTFSEPGSYRIRLIYQVAGGIEESVETEVLIRSGSISGTIIAAVDNLVDSDTRDIYEPDNNNNSFDNAQPIAGIGRLSGVVDVIDEVDARCPA